METLFQFALPLLAQVGRAQHRHALDFAPVEHFAGYQCAFNRFADTYVVGNQQPHGRELHGHEQRHQLVGAGLYGDVAKAAEGASAAAQLELQGIHEQLAGRVVAGLLDGRPREGGRPHGLGLQRQVDKGLVLLSTAQGAQAQGVGGGFGQHDPFTATGRDETAGVKLSNGSVHIQFFWLEPNRSALAANMVGHCSCSLGKRTTMKPSSSSLRLAWASLAFWLSVSWWGPSMNTAKL